MRQKFWELGGSRMGEAMRVKKEKVGDGGGGGGDDLEKAGDGNNQQQQQEEKEDTGGEVDYKKSSGFAAHVTKKSNKMEKASDSEFSRTKSLREQHDAADAVPRRGGVH